MTPVEYENLVNQILDGGLDIDKLTELVSAEKERREEKDMRESVIKELREDVIDAMKKYIGAIMNDADIYNYLDSDQCHKDFIESLESLEKYIKNSDELIKKYGFYFKNPIRTKEVDKLEDNVREWLKKKNREIQF